MPYVLTVDQVSSQQHADLVPPTIAALSAVPTVLPFTRTVGDEFQALLDQPTSVVDVILTLMRSGQWHVGLGLGPVEPLPSDLDPRSARGPAFVAARQAVEDAKRDAHHLRVVAAPRGEAEAADAEVGLRLVNALRERRTAQGWEATDLADTGLSQQAIAAELHVSRQAVSQRLQAAGWALEQAARPTVRRLLERAEHAAGRRRVEAS